MVTQRIANPIHSSLIHSIVTYKPTYLHLIQTASIIMGHSWATLSFETVESSLYLQSQPKCPKTLRCSFGTSYLRDLIFNKDTNLDFKFELLLNPIHPFML